MSELRPSYCRFCHNACAILVEVEEGRPVRVTGDRENPVFRGYCCIKGQQLPDQWAHPDRVRHTLARRADGQQHEVPVERALDEIAERLGSIVAANGPRAVASYTGTYSIANPATQAFNAAFMNALGSPMQFTSNTIDQPGKAVALAMHGTWMAPPQGFRGAEVALIVGGNPLVAMSGGVPAGNPSRELTDALRRGLQLIVIDPRRSETARRARLHLQPRPGHDSEILACLLHVIVHERLWDHDFVARHVAGFDALCEALEAFDPETVSSRIDVPAADLVSAARIFARARRGVATAGTGPNLAAQGTLFEYLLLALNTLCGRWLRAGERVPNPGALMPELSARAQAAPPWPAYGFGEKLRVRGLANTAAGPQTGALADEILLEGEGQVRALLSTGGNPVAAWPDQLKAIRAMEALELMVQVDVKMSSTARLADYVIAAKLPLEMPGMTQMQDYLQLYGVGFGYPRPYAQYTPAIVRPPEGSDVIEEWELFYGLAQRMGLSLELGEVGIAGPVEGTSVALDMEHKPTTDEIFELMTRRSRVSLEEVKRHPHGAEFPDPAVIVEPAGPQADARLDVGNPAILADLRRVAREGDALAAASGNDDQYAFRLLCRRSMNAVNSAGPELPGLTRKRSYNPAFMHPDDLAGLGLTAGETVEISSAHGRLLGVAEADPDLRRGVVSMTHAYGDLPDRDHELREIGSCTGRLSSTEYDYDPYTGQPRTSNIPVDVRPHSAPAE